MTSFDAQQNPQANAPQVPSASTLSAEVQQAIKEAQRAVEAAKQEAAAAQQQANAAAKEAAQARAQAGGSAAPGSGAIVFPSDNGDIEVRPTRQGILVTQPGKPGVLIPTQDIVPRGAVQITYALSAALIAVAVVGPLLRFFLRRFERRQVTHQLSQGVQDRLDAMERNIDTVAVELERVSEGQRFTNKLLEQQRPLEYAQRPDR